jgi:NAD(P)-dependent dehydrogenase (short-subunit alcohol dehydrogenase family)
MAVELASQNILVNVIAPGAIQAAGGWIDIEQPPTKVGGIEGRTESPYTG